jgi:polysaccharide export outer membrane protein
VAPDGNVALPRVGILNVNGLTQKQITDKVVTALKVYYERPEVTLVMKEYNNNRVFVLGRVTKPGEVHLQDQGTLLEALSLCGGMPDSVNKTYLSRCSIIRGKNLIMWIDLKALLQNGNMSLNARLQNGDVIFIPISEDSNAFVLGEVKTPGIVPLRTDQNLLNAIMTVGGPTKAANLKDVFLIRQSAGRGVVERINLQELIGKGNATKNYVLRDGDIVYVPESGFSKFNYFTSELQPFFTILGVMTSSISGFSSLSTLYYGTAGSSGSSSSSSSSSGSTSTGR